MMEETHIGASGPPIPKSNLASKTVQNPIDPASTSHSIITAPINFSALETIILCRKIQKYQLNKSKVSNLII